MSKHEWVKKFTAGLFFALGIVLLVFVIFVLGLERGFTKPKFQVHVLFSRVGGLSEGAPIRLSGVNVGVIDQINFLDKEVAGKNVQVALSIFSKYEKQFKRFTSISIKTEGVLGQKYIEINAQDQEREIDYSMPVIGLEPLDVEDLADVATKSAVAFQKTAQDLRLTTTELNSVMRQVNYISIKTQRLMNRIEQKLVDGDLFKLF